MEIYLIHLLTLASIYAILAQSLNLSIGFTGLVNLGHIAFFALGAYTSALLTFSGVPFPIAFIAAGIVPALFAPLLIFVTKSLKGDYFAVATLGFALVVHAVLLNWVGLTRGPLGLPGIPAPRIAGFTLSSRPLFFVVSFALAVLTYLFIRRLTTSRYGTVLAAVRDDELAAAALGKNTVRMKIESLMLAAFFAGIAGSLFAHYLTYIDPKSFYLTELILVLSIVIIGGLGSLTGTVAATLLVVLLPEALRFVAIAPAVIGPLRQMAYTALILLLLRYRPRGLFGTVSLE